MGSEPPLTPGRFIVVEHYREMLVRGGPRALAATKALLRRTPPASLEDFVSMLDLSAGFFASPEGQEGMAAFADERDPAWAPAH